MTTAAAPISPDHHNLIPPRKLLLNHPTAHFHKHLPCTTNNEDPNPAEIPLAHFYKHLPCNNENHPISTDDDDDDGDPYASDHFRMYEFKVRRCTRSRSHDWTDCPFAHPGEKARRRDPRKFHYTGAVCPEFRRGGGCGKGENCEFSHGVFECWLHPSRYRTEACKDGKGCARKVCFFAHSPRQLRLLPPEKTATTEAAARSNGNSSNNKVVGGGGHHYCGCLVCRGGGGSSPTSTLLGLSHLSPPLSPSFSSSPPLSPATAAAASGGGGGFSRRPLSKFQSRSTTYKDVLAELMASLEAMNFSEEAAVAAVAAAAAAAACSPTGKMNLSVNPWINEVNYGDDNHQLDQHQFVMSPSAPNYAPPNSFNSGFDKYLAGNDPDYSSPRIDGGDRREFGTSDYERNGDGLGGSDPDLGWVNELLM